jgi:hypothetical protein
LSHASLFFPAGWLCENQPSGVHEKSRRRSRGPTVDFSLIILSA